MSQESRVDVPVELMAFYLAYLDFEEAFEKQDRRGGPLDYRELSAHANELKRTLPKGHPQADVLNAAIEEGLSKGKHWLVRWAAEGVLWMSRAAA